MRFGIGLSPYELYRDFSGTAKADFLAKIRALDDVGLDDLAILFDDTRGDVPDLAAREADIVHTTMALTRATRVVMCPTYYSEDRMLDVLFGERPEGYLEELGRRLDPRVGVYWTGEEICARNSRPATSVAWPRPCSASRPCGTTTRSTTVRACRASCISGDSRGDRPRSALVSPRTPSIPRCNPICP